MKLKRPAAILLSIVVFFNLSSGQIISQYIETDSGTTPKGIEIWNNTENTLDFSANALVIEKGVNGATPAADFTLSMGTLSPGNVIVIGTLDLQTTTESNGSFFYLKGFTFNGDDALVVKYGGTITDVFGTPGVDPGSAWTANGVSTANQNIKLLADINSGDTDGWSDPSLRFETVSTTPASTGGDEGFGIAPESAPTAVDDPSAFTASVVSASAIDLAWSQNANSDNVMIVYNMDGNFSDPVDGTAYSVSSSALGGTVIYNQSGTSFSHTSLSGGTTYYYKAWSVDGSNNYSAGLTDNASTVKAEPSDHVLSFSAESNYNSITLTWSDNDGLVPADAYLIKASSISLAAITAPVDGYIETDDNDLSDGTAAVNVAHGTQSFDFTGLSSETNYYFKIWPYSNTDSNIDYKTDGTVPEATQATTTIPNYIIDLDFELAGGYTTNIPEFSDGGTDYFTRTDGNDIGSMNFSNIQGDYYFAAQDLDGEGATLPLTLTIDDADISGMTDLSLSLLIAEDDASDGLDDWDDADYVHIDYDIDNSGVFTNLLHIEAAGGTNSAPMIDTDFDGFGDGALLTNAFTEFSAAIAGTGSLIDIKITFSLDSGDEDIALDDIRLTGAGSQSVEPEPSNHVLDLTGTSTYNSIELTWLDNNGDIPAENFIIKASNVSLDAISDPVDGMLYENDTDLGDGSAVMTIGAGTMNYTWVNLDPSTAYYFKIYPYTNNAPDMDFKTDGVIPAITVITAGLPRIVITEIMMNPDFVSDLNGEWFELYNADTAVINIDGWTISDNGSDLHTISNGGTLNIAPGDYLVLGADSSSLTNGGYVCDYLYGNYSLSNTGDEIILKNSSTIIDSISYDNGTYWPDPAGASMVYTGSFSEDNNDYSKWIAATERLSGFIGTEGDKGSPGASRIITAILNIKLFLQGCLSQL